MASPTETWSFDRDYLSIRVLHKDLDQNVLGVRVVVHTTGRMGNSNASDNHVTQYLLLPGQSSIQINMRHTVDDLNGHLEIQSRNYRGSRTEIEHYPPGTTNTDQSTSREVRTNFTFRGVLHHLQRNGLDGFTFAGGGMGCRAWHVVLMSMYESNTWVSQGSTQGLHRYLSYQRSTREAPRHITIQQGTFDDTGAQKFANERWQALQHLVHRYHTMCYQQYQIHPTTDLAEKIRELDQQQRDLAESATKGAQLVAERQQEDDDEDDDEDEDEDE
ncbi:hypothetical protein KC331_g19908 [Hortaea werneckii]|nr:hypothetical protein KC361_g9275 [Hortaea werneckii]KAI6855425.1 hypothetical protein KC323_g8309 [Hortaea werneckii]KAI7152713.1 hypothetical protein KC349_g8815 [Hortaea werneckii]KAI7223156.1 hypothetical protein KC365_g11201 [Hortaea werneckii]KAI7345200.1 hypothetical protein KC320_g8438 [Hortaea werneckii]